MKRFGVVTLFVVIFSLLVPTFAVPADDAKVKEGMSQVERGAKKIPSSQVGDGVQETARGIGTTVSEGAKYSGEKLKDAGQATEAPAKSAWGHTRDGVVGVGHSVKSFFTNLFSN
jgi:hypothetical protein